MKMLISPTSPYARKARILVAEKNLHCEMQVVNPYQEDADYVSAASRSFCPMLLAPAWR